MADIKIHSFNTSMAEKLGIEGALLFGDIYFWCLKNKLNNNNLKMCEDGKERYFTYNSVEALRKNYHYINSATIYRTLTNLEKAGYILSGCFNNSPFDRTKWYAVTELGESLYKACSEKQTVSLYEESSLILQSEKSEFAKCKMRIFKVKNLNLQNEEPIPDTNTDTDTDSKTYTPDDSLCSSSSAADEPPLENHEDDATPPWEKNLKSTGLVRASEYHADNKPPVKKTKTRKPRVPLSDREPVNDIERVEKAYMKAWEEARKKKLSLSEEPVSGFKTIGSQRKLIKSWLVLHDVDSVINAVLLSAKDDFCRNTLDMRLRSIMSEGVFCRLLDGRIQGESYGRQQKREAFVDGKERDYSDTDF